MLAMVKTLSESVAQYQATNLMMIRLDSMQMTFSLAAETSMPAHYAIDAPRRSDSISRALQRAFEAPREDSEMAALLRRIDAADRPTRKS